MSDGPLKSAIDSMSDMSGVVKQEFITYRVKDGILRKETTVRKFFGDDYNDSSTTEPLLKVMS